LFWEIIQKLLLGWRFKVVIFFGFEGVYGFFGTFI
jgi:hypothetical protein